MPDTRETGTDRWKARQEFEAWMVQRFPEISLKREHSGATLRAPGQYEEPWVRGAWAAWSHKCGMESSR